MRIAIANDVPMTAEAVRRVVVKSGQHKVAWVARDGAEAVALCARDTPDLILMDLVMPRMDGVEATRRIMGNTPCPILVVTGNVGDNRAKVFEAMGAGAVDVVNVPVMEYGGARWDPKALLAKVETMRRLIGAPNQKNRLTAQATAAASPVPPRKRLVAIGASAGGPTALARILARLPVEFPAAVVIVQHVDAEFAPGLAAWLGDQSRLEVRVANAGDRPEPGTALLAGRDDHLAFASAERLTYTRHPADCPYRPSIDVFFKSVDRHWRGEALGVLLTGMGRDGAEGLRAMRTHGHHTIAQDRASSAVYGMPKAAAELHAASEVLSLDGIASRLTHILARRPKYYG